MTKIIKHQIFYPFPAHVIWDYLTVPALMEQWLMPNNFSLVKDHEFTFKSKPMATYNFDGIFYCKVLEIVPFKKLIYSWDFGPGNGVLYKSEVEWILTDETNGTTLILIHRGFDGCDALPLFAAMDQGWLSNIHKILKLLSPPAHEQSIA